MESDNHYLAEKLSGITAHISSRENAAAMILSQPTLMTGLLHHCFSSDKKLSPRACWVLEFVCKENLDLLLPHQEYFSLHMTSLKNDSAIRPVAKVCEMICTEYFQKKDPYFCEKVSPNTLDAMTETLFDWLIEDIRVATKAYAMQSLFLLSAHAPWIAPELKLVLEAGINKHSAAYKARARHLLRELSEEK